MFRPTHFVLGAIVVTALATSSIAAQAPGVRSVGEVFMHVASEYYFFTPAVFGAVPSPVVEANKAGFEKFEKMSSKPEVLKHLQEGFAYGRQAVATLDEAKIIGLT